MPEPSEMPALSEAPAAELGGRVEVASPGVAPGSSAHETAARLLCEEAESGTVDLHHAAPVSQTGGTLSSHVPATGSAREESNLLSAGAAVLRTARIPTFKRAGGGLRESLHVVRLLEGVLALSDEPFRAEPERRGVEVDLRGIAPRSPVCGAGILLLN